MWQKSRLKCSWAVNFGWDANVGKRSQQEEEKQRGRKKMWWKMCFWAAVVHGAEAGVCLATMHGCRHTHTQISHGQQTTTPGRWALGFLSTLSEFQGMKGNRLNIYSSFSIVPTLLDWPSSSLQICASTQDWGENKEPGHFHVLILTALSDKTSESRRVDETASEREHSRPKRAAKREALHLWSDVHLSVSLCTRFTY